MKNPIRALPGTIFLFSAPVDALVSPECAYISNAPGARVEPRGPCVRVSGEGVSLLPAVHFDKGPDRYSEGLVRSVVRGKMAFHDEKLTLVLEPRYDWAWPFDKGRALVCPGCAAGPPDSAGHREVTGGKWGSLDKQGNEIVPVTLTREEALGWR